MTTAIIDAPPVIPRAAGAVAWRVPSRSNPAIHHIVERDSAGELHCDCTAAAFGRDCHHRAAVRSLVTREGETLSIARIEPNATAVGMWSVEEQRIIKDQIAGGMKPPITDIELAYFAQVCKARGLSPIAGQIVPVRRGGRMVIQVTIHGFRSIADATEDYAPGRRTTFETDASGNLVSATAYAKKYARGTWHEIEETAYWDEYAQYYTDDRSGERRLMGLWPDKPRLMLAKCAEALVLRKGWPVQLGGIYTDDELGHGAPELARPAVAGLVEEARRELPAAARRATPAEIGGKPVPAGARPSGVASSKRFGEFWPKAKAAGYSTDDVHSISHVMFGKAADKLETEGVDALEDALVNHKAKLTQAGEWSVELPSDETVEAGATIEEV